MSGLDDLPMLEDGLTPRQRALLAAITQLAGPRRAMVPAQRVLEAVLGGRAPSLDARLVAGQRDGDPYLVTYLALVELAQAFRTRYPLIDGLGNFGTIDGDPPADSMFVRCAPSAFGAAALRGVAPTFLVNGSPPSPDGTSLPHRLGDVLDAAALLIAAPATGDDALIAAIPGPDFPTGGVVPSTDALGEIDRTGRGELRVRARATVSDDGGSIVVTELPPGVWKRDLVGDLSRRAALAGVSDRSDEHGVRVELALRPGADADAALAELFASTALEAIVRVETRAVIDGAPRVVALPALVRAYVQQLAAALAREGDASPARMLAELDALRAAHGDPRRTRLGAA